MVLKTNSGGQWSAKCWRGPIHKQKLLSILTLFGIMYIYMALKANYQLIYKHPVFSAFHLIQCWLQKFGCGFFSWLFLALHALTSKPSYYADDLKYPDFKKFGSWILGQCFILKNKFLKSPWFHGPLFIILVDLIPQEFG